VIPRLQKPDLIVFHAVHDAMLARQSARPGVRVHVLERFGLSDTHKWRSQNGLNHRKRAQGASSIRFHPVLEVFSEVRVEDSEPFPRF